MLVSMEINRMMIKRTHWFPRNMLQEVNEQAMLKGVSDSDIIRMAVKEYLKREKRKI